MSKSDCAVVVTHGGRQHADEILACWFYAVLCDIRVIRSSNPEDWKYADILLDCGGVYDPGNHRIDHHGTSQIPTAPRGRLSGYATAGLVWRLYGSRICVAILREERDGPWRELAESLSKTQMEACLKFFSNIMDQEVVALVDAWDLGIYPPKMLSRLALPCQWLLPHLDFEVAMDALGSAFAQRLRLLAESVATEKMLMNNMLCNGPSEFYVFGEWLVILAAPGKRIDVKSAKAFAGKVVGIPLLAVLSSLRAGTRWGAFFLEALPNSISIPRDIEYAAGRRTLFHDDPRRLMSFVRECSSSNALHIPELRVVSAP